MNCDCITRRLRHDTVSRMLEDLIVLLVACFFGSILVCRADPTFTMELGGAILMVLGTSTAIIIYSAMIGGSRILALSMAGMLPIALTVQALILQNRLCRTDEINHYAMMMVITVTAALILVPFFVKLFQDSAVEAVKNYFWLVIWLIVDLLLYLSCEIRGSSGWVRFGGVTILWTVAMMPFVLSAFSLYMTDEKLSARKQIVLPLVFLAFYSLVLISICAYDQLTAFALTVIVLACLQMRSRKNLWFFVAVVGCLVVGLLLFTGKYDNAGNYQLECVRQTLGKSLLLPSDEVMYIPAAQHTNTFAALVQRMGLLFAFGVLGLVCIIFRKGLHICRHTGSCAAGGVGLAFLVYLMVNALVGTASSLGLFPSTDLDFPMLSASGSVMFSSAFMLAYLLVLSAEANQEPGVVWSVPRRQCAAVWGVVVCCVVIALTCVVLSFGGGAEKAPVVSTNPTEPMLSEDYAAIVDEILSQAEFTETAFPMELSSSWSFPEYPYTMTVAHAYLHASNRIKANPFSVFYELYESGLFDKERCPAEPYQIVGFTNESEVPQSGYLTDYVPEPRHYFYDDHDAQKLLYDILELSTWFENMLTNSDWLVSMVNPDDFNIRFNSSDNCYYAYFLCQDMNESWVLNFYFFPDAEQMYIENVEFQILQIVHDYWSGLASDSWSRTVGSLISAIDYTVHGHSRFEEGDCFQGYTGRGNVILNVPTACWCGEIQSALEYSQYTEGDDPQNPVSVIEVVSYRLHS